MKKSPKNTAKLERIYAIYRKFEEDPDGTPFNVHFDSKKSDYDGYTFIFEDPMDDPEGTAEEVLGIEFGKEYRYEDMQTVYGRMIAKIMLDKVATWIYIIAAVLGIGFLVFWSALVTLFVLMSAFCIVSVVNRTNLSNDLLFKGFPVEFTWGDGHTPISKESTFIFIRKPSKIGEDKIEEESEIS